ncbi:ABC transporter permease [Aliikangiella coralliicola]|uniref:FtsX-like permease family protein n=1 Tax=Aliikangiella coralliicola TaxID=2592383 RepID=A0A545UH79_9GAMM|nr:ABC transporter permease [Aliikangiella coralliicola]TQV88822.1 FtsX-like permease family protein [Aliikangiella coralliicola]
MNQFAYNLKQAWARLKRKPGFIVNVMLSMGVTLGALIFVSTLAYVMLLKPLPYPEQDRLFVIDSSIKLSGKPHYFSKLPPAAILDLYQNQEIFETATISYQDSKILTSDPAAPTKPVEFVTPEWFQIYGVSMMLGRGFEQTEMIGTNNPVAVLSYAIWKNDFKGRKEIVGEKITLGDVSFTVVGVMAKDFILPRVNMLPRNRDVQVILPIDFDRSQQTQALKWNPAPNGVIVGKLKDSYSVVQAEHWLGKRFKNLWQKHAADIRNFNELEITLNLQEFRTQLLGDSKQYVYFLLVAVLGLVIIASTNITNLFLSFTAEQQHQMTVHAALGAKRKSLFKFLFYQTGILVVFSVLLALFIASLGFYFAQHYFQNLLPRLNELSFNLFTFNFSLILIVIFTTVFSFVGSRIINYRKLIAGLQSSGKGVAVQVSKSVRYMLIILQVAVAIALIFINVNLMKEPFNKITQPVVYELEGLMTLWITIKGRNIQDYQDAEKLIPKLRKELSERAEIDILTFSEYPGYHTDVPATDFLIVDGKKHYFKQFQKTKMNNFQFKNVDYQYFESLRWPLLQGKSFSQKNEENQEKVIIVNDAFAREISPEGNVIGKKITLFTDQYSMSHSFYEEEITSGQVEKADYEIIGVVEGLITPSENFVPRRFYLPRLELSSIVECMFRLKENLVLKRETVVSLLNNLDRSFKLIEYEPMIDNYKEFLFPHYTTLVITIAIALLTIFLTSIGIYGILNYSIQVRRFELGTRLAMGAKRKDLVRLILKDNAKAIGFGVLMSLVVLPVIYLLFSDKLAKYINLELLPAFVATLTLIGCIAWMASYLPLRKIINRPAIYSLRGSD